MSLSVENNRLEKSERICSIKQIQDLLTNGKSNFVFPFKIYTLIVNKSDENDKNVKILISVPKKNIKKAFQRNKIKRRIRESYRLCKSSYYNLIDDKSTQMLIAFIFVEKKIITYNEINKAIKEIPSRLSN